MGEDVYLEKLYRRVMTEDAEIITPKNVDFVGININPRNGTYEFKRYDPPEVLPFTFVRGETVVEQAMEMGIVRCICRVNGTSGARTYFSLKNRTDQNMERLIRLLADRYAHIRNNVAEIELLSAMKVTDAKTSSYESMHMLGIKSASQMDGIVGVEWMLRKLPDPDAPGACYRFDDAYFVSYIDNVGGASFRNLLYYIQKEKLISTCDDGLGLHLWLAAVDYYPDGSKKYKLYMKGEGLLDISKVSKSFCNICPSVEPYVSSVLRFLRSHTDLELYGFAICIDTNQCLSFNYYFIAEN